MMFLLDSITLESLLIFFRLKKERPGNLLKSRPLRALMKPLKRRLDRRAWKIMITLQEGWRSRMRNVAEVLAMRHTPSWLLDVQRLLVETCYEWSRAGLHVLQGHSTQIPMSPANAFLAKVCKEYIQTAITSMFIEVILIPGGKHSPGWRTKPVSEYREDSLSLTLCAGQPVWASEGYQHCTWQCACRNTTTLWLEIAGTKFVSRFIGLKQEDKTYLIKGPPSILLKKKLAN